MSASRAANDPPCETILLVEDNRALREGVALNLRMHGYAVVGAPDGESGMRLAFDERPDLIVLDLMLPGCGGLDILRELRKRGETVPVLILSARDTTPDKVAGLNLGADDYLAKPFDLAELLARVKVLLRRQAVRRETLPALTFGDVVVDRAARRLCVRGRPVDLSAKEFDLLCLLAESREQVFTRATILDRVWGWDYEGTARTVDNVVASLRKKLAAGGARRAVRIATVPKVGYRLDAS